ncbi:Lysine biosynthesis regulatory protein LYS14 like [Verticillium longisporum]|uniref:Lysine biosynthesis regulatory protein LYS14 like n=1 Tax=Verticillium longisporum TaxID=100787 RepID=A0A8I3A0V4_VERLO|nr:Lysine biosynthesis regulatory protein LYS14 like [Verticillium longisporum]KAG7141285.1 Lysine biosynthesis regulatory protein LYS14 like [Verticillium longisporum]
MAPKFQVMSLDEAGLTIREHKKRKYSPKTRAGCVSCKQRRVKCDETQPTCLRCRRNQRACLYDKTPLTSGRDPRRSPVAGQSPQSSTSSSSAALVAQPAFELPVPVDAATKYGGTPAGVLLQFFNENHDNMLAGAPLHAVWDMACTYPHLLTAILGASACYLRHHTANPAAHQIAETYQQTLTIQSLQASLAKPLSRDRADALQMTAIFLNLLAFTAVPDENPLASWVFSTAPDRLGWMNILLGFKPLLIITAAFRRGSLMTPMYASADDEEGTFTRPDLVVDLPPAWSAFLARTTRRADLFAEPVYILAATRLVAPWSENVYQYMQFVGRVEPAFRDLLLAGDERALWVFGYWLGLVGRFDMWWSRMRIRRDFEAIVMCLRARGLTERGHGEGDMWTELLDDLEGLREQWSVAMRRPTRLPLAS